MSTNSAQMIKQELIKDPTPLRNEQLNQERYNTKTFIALYPSNTLTPSFFSPRWASVFPFVSILIKTLGHADSLERFRSTIDLHVATLRRIKHPNVLQFIDCVEINRYICLCYFYGSYAYPQRSVESWTLTKLVGSRPLDVASTINYAIQILRGLDHLHANKVIHGHLSPQHIQIFCGDIVVSGYLHIMDVLTDSARPSFVEHMEWVDPEIVKRFCSKHALFKRSRVAPSPQLQEGIVSVPQSTEIIDHFSAQEASDSSDVTYISTDGATPESDVYSFGLVIYYLLTAIMPCSKLSFAEIIESKLSVNSVDIRHIQQPFMRQIIEACIDRNPNNRPKIVHLLSSLEYCSDNILITHEKSFCQAILDRINPTFKPPQQQRSLESIHEGPPRPHSIMSTQSLQETQPQENIVQSPPPTPLFDTSQSGSYLSNVVPVRPLNPKLPSPISDLGGYDSALVAKPSTSSSITLTTNTSDTRTMDTPILTIPYEQSILSLPDALHHVNLGQKAPHRSNIITHIPTAKVLLKSLLKPDALSNFLMLHCDVLLFLRYSHPSNVYLTHHHAFRKLQSY
eukprot:TRINITY_DN6936_c0_g1_i1.p1 TRINITY_DN6936_c0_g1~~TRINITY_DN6936_c0_g1_i1.p1  ORF type:complete len:568 (-),score=76.36 TRINITY_DN6936_c0_g1_i1:1829-3532(-)